MNVMNTSRAWFVAAVLAGCALVPLISHLADDAYWPGVFMRGMIWAIAAISLNLILGFGGMISFGHAVFLGLGAYAVGILAYYDINNGWLQLLTVLGACGLGGLVFGAISLRTRGVYFIMITMALSQMIYYLIISIDEYGSDDGLIIYNRSDFGLSFYSLDHENTLYYTIFVALLASLWLTRRIVHSRFGNVIRGAATNETRMHALGFSTYWYRLTCFVIAGLMCGLAGMLSANVETFVSPDMLHWKISGELIFMVVLGGMGTVFGPVAGALVFWLMSVWLPQLPHVGEYWGLIFGPFLILIVLFFRKGIDGLFDARKPKPQGEQTKGAES